MTAILTDRTAKSLLARERLESYAAGEWVRGTGKGAELFHAVTGEKIGEASSEGLDFKAMVEYARTVGGPALRRMTFHERAGMPAIVKPATVTSYLTEAVFRAMIESRIFPDGAIQLVCGSAGDLIDHLDCQCAVAFTGSASTGHMLKAGKSIIENSVRFNQEADSLNFSMLAPDATPGSDEFDLFVKEVTKEMTAKAGQKCTAIRRTLVPENMSEDVMRALSRRLESTRIGDPSVEGVRMGPLAGRTQVKEVRHNADQIASDAELVFGNLDRVDVVGADPKRGAFFPALLFYSDTPFSNTG